MTVSKRSFAALAVFLAMIVLGAFCISWADRAVLAPEDAVQFTTVSQTGDPSVAKGLKARILEDTGISLRHIYDMEFGGSEPQISVSHEFPRDDGIRGFYPGAALSINFDVLNSQKLQEDADKEIKKLAAGESKDIVINVSQIYEYYPIAVHWYPEYGTNAEYYAGEADVPDYLYSQFQEAFRIKVPKDLELKLHIESYDGQSGMSYYDYVDLDRTGALAMFSFSGIRIGDAYYIALYNTNERKLEGLDDVVLRIPIGELQEPVRSIMNNEKITKGPLVDQMERWYVPEAPFKLSTYQSLTLSGDGTVLYILSSDGDTFRVAALEAGMERPAETDVPDVGSKTCNYYLSGSDIILYVKGKAFNCITRQRRGDFALRTFPIGGTDSELGMVYGASNYSKVAYDNGRIAVCCVDPASLEVRSVGARAWYSGFMFSVYTESGPQYSVKLHSSITDAADFPTGTEQIYFSPFLAINSLSW